MIDKCTLILHNQGCLNIAFLQKDDIINIDKNHIMNSVKKIEDILMSSLKDYNYDTIMSKRSDSIILLTSDHLGFITTYQYQFSSSQILHQIQLPPRTYHTLLSRLYYISNQKSIPTTEKMKKTMLLIGVWLISYLMFIFHLKSI